MLSFDELVDELKSGCKSKSDCLIGVEHEQFAYNRQTGAPLSYDGKIGIRALLDTFTKQNNWTQVLEDGHPIALNKKNRNGSVIGLTLEPGGQVEYAGSPLKTLLEVAQEMVKFQKELHLAAESTGIAFLQKGLHPSWSRNDIHWMPKQRYDIMRNYMPTKGSHGLDMMMRSCGTQLNIDVENEEDMVRKFRVCLAIQPVIIALMANSSHLDGEDTGYASYRTHVWANTDPDRSGFPAFVFDSDMGFDRYVNYALDVPMYFIRRNGKYIDMSGKSFREFMNGTLDGYEEQYASMQDWQDHITTLFPEVRLKRYLELRSADSHTPDMIMAMTAFWVGIIYDATTLDKVYRIIQNWPTHSIEHLYHDAAKDGLNAKTKGMPALWDITKDLLDLAAKGLQNQPRNRYSGHFLQPFQDYFDSELKKAA